MSISKKQTTWQTGLFSVGHLFNLGSLALVLRNVFDVWELVRQLRHKIGYHGLYEILEYDATLEIMDPRGEDAIIGRHEVIRFLQDNVVAIHDHAWGEGELFAEYQCQPGIPVDFYEDGSKYNILISLRETKNRGDLIDLRIERGIKGGFPQKDEWLETEIDHWVEHLKLSIVFPEERPCRRATLRQRSTNETIALNGGHFSFLSDGRQILTWQTNRPKLHDLYTIKWSW
jgi:hypothetical protein